MEAEVRGVRVGAEGKEDGEVVVVGKVVRVGLTGGRRGEVVGFGGGWGVEVRGVRGLR